MPLSRITTRSWWHEAIIQFSHTKYYPTRTVEHMLAWMVLIWSWALIQMDGNAVSGALERLAVIAPEYVWGGVGVTIGLVRIIALFINGRWENSPGIRLIGAAFGMTWWMILSALYFDAVRRGAPDFPMRYVFVVFIYFEAYCCYRCGQDYAHSRSMVTTGVAEGGARYG